MSHFFRKSTCQTLVKQIKVRMKDIVETIKENEGMVNVTNVEGHYYVPKGYDSWLDYWEQKMGEDATGCERKGCRNTDDIVGGHVYKGDDYDNIYLVPICKDHNHYIHTEKYQVPEDKLLLVPRSDLKRDILEDWLTEVGKNKGQN